MNWTTKDLKQKKPKLYEVLTLDLSTAQANKKVEFEGNFFYVQSAPEGVNIQAAFNENDRDALSLIAGDTISIPFYRFYLTWPAQAGKSVTILVGNDISFALHQQLIQSVAGSIKLAAAGSWNLNSSPVAVDDGAGHGGAAALVLAANPSRKSGMIYNEGAAPCRIGKAGVKFTPTDAASAGFLLPVGSWKSIEHAEALYAICDAGLDTQLSIEEAANT